MRKETPVFRPGRNCALHLIMVNMVKSNTFVVYVMRKEPPPLGVGTCVAYYALQVKAWVKMSLRGGEAGLGINPVGFGVPGSGQS